MLALYKYIIASVCFLREKEFIFMKARLCKNCSIFMIFLAQWLKPAKIFE